jgi:hypothetical protein
LKKHFNTQDARLVLKEYHNFIFNSPKANNKRSEIHTALTNYKFGSDHKSAEQFITDYTNLFQQLDDLTEDIDDYLTDHQKLAYLRSSVKECPDLYRVEVDLQLLGRTIDYDAYEELLEYAAITYDSKFKPSRRPRGVHVHQFHYEAIDSELPDDVDYDDSYDPDYQDYAETPSSSYDINYQDRSGPRHYNIPPFIWSKLSDQERQQVLDLNKPQRPHPQRPHSQHHQRPSSSHQRPSSGHQRPFQPKGMSNRPYPNQHQRKVHITEEVPTSDTPDPHPTEYDYHSDFDLMDLAKGELPAADPCQLLTANKTAQ